MALNPNSLSQTRRTASDALFDQIRDDINKMRLVPGTKISEADVAKQYDVSRQPVREAFIRLDNLSLLQIRPQKATIVRRISKSAIQQARFVRAAVEIEVARMACQVDKPECIKAMRVILQNQSDCLKNGDLLEFHLLDHDFHKHICLMADCDYAIDIIHSCKTKVDRLCMLSLKNENDADDVYNDHVNIIEHLSNHDEKKLVQSIREHLARLDHTIELIQSEHTSYFED